MSEYEILDQKAEDSITLRKLAELLFHKTQSKIAFFDIVSVEVKTNKKYSVKWFGNNDDFLKQYYKLIKNYFDKPENKSLLFLESINADLTKNGISSRHVAFENLQEECSCIVNLDRCLATEFEVNDSKDKIAISHERLHLNRWRDEILSKLCIALATFSKIEFQIAGRDFIAAIWIGYNDSTHVPLNNRDEVFTTYIENFLWSYTSKSIASELIIESERQATRAAISQVMARNTSHNIGAHVMNKLIGSLRELDFLSYKKGKNYKTAIELKNHLHNDIVRKMKDNTSLTFLNRNEKVVALHNEIILAQIAIFNNYVKCRMDYLADISFGTPLMQTNKYAYADVFKEFDKVRLLLEHIAGLSDFKFEIKFQRNGTNLVETDDLLIAIPNDILGMQAFYNILENVIRNTAKYAAEKPNVTLFTVNFIDELNDPTPEQNNVLNDFIAIEVYDNIPIEGVGRELTEEEKKVYKGKRVIKEDKEYFESQIEELVFSQNAKINTDILQDNRLRSGSLGVIEMDASAAYLRKRDVSYINHHHYDIIYNESWSNESKRSKEADAQRGTNCRNFLKAFKKDSIEPTFPYSVKSTNGIIKKRSTLGYRFFVLRPEVVLIVTNFSCSKSTELKKEGVWIVTPDSFKKHLEKGKVYNHEFVVYNQSEGITSKDNGKPIDIPKLIRNHVTALPVRILNLKDLEVKMDESGPDKKANSLNDLFEIVCQKERVEWLLIFEEFCWTRWEKELMLKYNYSKYSYEHYPVLANNDARITDHLKPNENKTIAETWEGLKGGAYFVEPTSSKAQSYLPGLKNRELKVYYKILEENIQSKIRIAESILTRVAVIDERVQENGLLKPMGIIQREVYEMMRVNIPEKSEINLSQTSFDPMLTKAIHSFINEAVKCNDFILIHYSILERLFQSEANRLDVINNFLKDLAGITNVVITSGRGIPDRLPAEVAFLNLSSVIMAFNEVKSKHLINYLLHSAKKTNKI